MNHANLSNTLWTLRKTFGDNVVKTDGNRLMLADTVWTDIQQFESTVESLLTEDAPGINELQAAPSAGRCCSIALWHALRRG